MYPVRVNVVNGDTTGAQNGYLGPVTTYGDRLNAAVAAQLRAERAASEMTIAQLVEASGIGKSQLLRLIHAKRDIDMRDIAVLSEALNIEPDELMRRAQARLEQLDQD